MTGSSIEGGIFGDGSAPAPRAVKQGITDSSLEGGVFGAPTSNGAAAPRTGVTKSSVDGGIFGGNNPYAVSEPTAYSRPAVPQIDADRVAGQALPPTESFSLFAGAPAPLAPLPSARSNPNAPSVEGGIFGAPRAAQKPQIARANPNASSIQGGIFG